MVVVDGRPGARCAVCSHREVRRNICGTEQGYRLHLEQGEDPCDPCRGASAALRRQYRKLRAV